MLTVINSQQELEEFCANFLDDEPEFACIDTEFIRQTTYWPKLALIQIASPFRSCIIDPVGRNLSLEPFLRILRHPGITKVLHSGRQDLEIFLSLFQELPFPVFDTQIAAAFLGLGSGVGYDKLVNHFLNISIDKTSQHTNWLKRPLSKAQLNYAMDDVMHLRVIYPLICEQLQQKGRMDWVQDSFTALMSKEMYLIDIDKAWLKLKHQIRKWEALSILRDLCAWREEKARHYNLSRATFIEDKLLIDLCQVSFLSFESVLEFIKKYRHSIVSQNLTKEFYLRYSQAHRLTENKEKLGEIRQREMKQSLQKIYPKSQPDAVKERLQKLKDIINALANELEIPAHFIADKSDMESFSKEPSDDHKLLQGWKRNLLKDKLKTFLDFSEAQSH